ncbi:aminoacetone oxidase family FAD-binding enzyme [Paraphotobacterium marinum]|uniref:Aminoacetone oxidase family FAD-binding enzyme n=1 Tax=Paraphotobacterium marinum TaxID=1755811 RepID=A0A220VCK3_9GAMM|nr:NAD(P)/FAD-dependent oxidoreductase [Paraphotobacterium marinum]ASK78077.1 aminoacetone oxidase family FAD-binding enzyme [Paraphotobacterium marinum]
MKSDNLFDVIIIGAGAAGLMAAISASERNKKVLVLDHAKRPGKKILISGGGRCNFTNYYIEPSKYISSNPHFCKSALNQYTQWDFISLVEKYDIAYHEKTLGQLFCDQSAKDIVSMLLSECEKNQVSFRYQQEIDEVKKDEKGYFFIKSNDSEYKAHSLIIASGGLSMPRLGATPFAYKVAESFDLDIVPTKAALVPLTLDPILKDLTEKISGISHSVNVFNEKAEFSEDLLFTHRGLSGPAVLQISSYWNQGEDIKINLLPTVCLKSHFDEALKSRPNCMLKTFLNFYFAKRLTETLLVLFKLKNIPIKQLSSKDLKILSQLQEWAVKPAGSEGYRTAEVTLGGVNTDAISSKTMEVKSIPGLFFIGEALDVTGWLGGYNFQWAWSSGWVAGKNA